MFEKKFLEVTTHYNVVSLCATPLSISRGLGDWFWRQVCFGVFRGIDCILDYFYRRRGVEEKSFPGV